jgi:hypothetical protein
MTTDTIGLHQTMVILQESIRSSKSTYNTFGKFYYRTAEDIIDAAKPFLYIHKLTLIINDEIINLGVRYYVKVTCTISNGHESISNSSVAREAQIKKGMDEAMITGSSISYARKYCLAGLFALADKKDDPDAKNNSNDPVNEFDPSPAINSLNRNIFCNSASETLDIWMSLSKDQKVIVWEELTTEARAYIKDLR